MKNKNNVFTIIIMEHNIIERGEKYILFEAGLNKIQCRSILGAKQVHVIILQVRIK